MKLSLLPLLLSLACCLPPFYSPRSLSSIEHLRSSTVAIVDQDEDGDTRALCSGVWVDSKRFVTAYHCVDEYLEKARVQFVVSADVFDNTGLKVRQTIRPRWATIAKTDEGHDLALLRVLDQVGPHQTSEVAKASPKVGDQVQTMGHSMGLWWSYSSGDISAVRIASAPMEGTMLWVQTTAPISPGNSGGGLFDADGALAGVAHASSRHGQQLNLFVHPSYIQRLLD